MGKEKEYDFQNIFLGNNLGSKFISGMVSLLDFFSLI
jgi:hypothetical protein